MPVSAFPVAVAVVSGSGEAAERGRYAVYTSPDGGPPVIGRAVGLCETCAACGCGEQQDPVEISPSGIMKVLSKNGFKMPGPKEMLRLMSGHGQAVTRAGNGAGGDAG